MRGRAVAPETPTRFLLACSRLDLCKSGGATADFWMVTAQGGSPELNGAAEKRGRFLWTALHVDNKRKVLKRKCNSCLLRFLLLRFKFEHAAQQFLRLW